jgi:hypothetical protein
MIILIEDQGFEEIFSFKEEINWARMTYTQENKT